MHTLSPRRVQNIILLLGSLFFYAWGEFAYTNLLLLCIISAHCFALAIHGSQSSTKQRWLCIGHISITLGILAYFKYGSFILNNIGITQESSLAHLPIGISFFTFQSISYVYDVWRKQVKPEKNIINSGLYIALFPQLIAGPIVRYKEIKTELSQRSASLVGIRNGIQLFIIGLTQKTLIADIIAPIADAAFTTPLDSLTMFDAWIGAVCFGLQIYFDFLGYSNMAIGLGLLFGFHLPQNFNLPYMSRSITEFWRRWHITLTNWFKDYVYIPLGGNRNGLKRTMLNILIVFSLSGLWHGAAWTFIIWGLWFGFLICLEQYWKVMKLPTISMSGHMYVLLAVLMGWVFFRSESISNAVAYSTTLIHIKSAYLSSSMQFLLSRRVLISIVIAILWSTPLIAKIRHKILRDESVIQSISYDIVLIGLFLLCIMQLATSTYSPFIYFQF